MTAVLLILLFGLLILGAPIYMTLVLSSAGAMLYGGGMNAVAIIQRMTAGIDKFSIMAVPFFMFCADIMSHGEIGKRLINVCKAFFGHMHGGLAIATTIACLIFGAISGAGSAAVVAVGGIVYVLMKEGNYDERFSLGLILTTSTLAMLIPPSIAYILYANITGDSINTLFMSGLGGGIIFGLLLCIYSYVYARIKKIPVLPKASIGERLKALKESLLSLGMIVIILGGIYGGICTATEAAAIACVYAVVIEMFVYRSISIKELFRVSVKSAQTISMLMILIAAGSVLSWTMTVMQLPVLLTNLLSGASWLTVFLLINMIFLIAGMFIDPNSAIIVLVPLIFPMAQAVGINSVQLGTVMVINLAIGMLSPPFGLNIFVGTSVFKKSFSEIVPGLFPFIALSVIVLLLFTLLPELSLFLSKLMLR